MTLPDYDEHLEQALMAQWLALPKPQGFPEPHPVTDSMEEEE